MIDSSGQRYSATTDNTGVGQSPRPPGRQLHDLWLEERLPAGDASASVANDSGSASLTLKSGQVATTSLTSTPLTKDQIIAAGIDPNDPNNQNVYQFEIHLAFTPLGDTVVSWLRGRRRRRVAVVPRRASTSAGHRHPATASQRECTYTTGGYSVVTSVQWVDNQPELLWLIIPGRGAMAEGVLQRPDDGHEPGRSQLRPRSWDRHLAAAVRPVARADCRPAASHGHDARHRGRPERDRELDRPRRHRGVLPPDRLLRRQSSSRSAPQSTSTPARRPTCTCGAAPRCR